jgi:hypothetical protein
LIATAVAGIGALSWPASGASRRQASAPGPVPQGFVGVVVDEPVWPDPFVDIGRQMDSMVAAGVESVRVTFVWAQAQPYRSWKRVPHNQRARFVSVGGVPTDFSVFDQIVGAASSRGLTVMPTILDAPGWDGIRRKGAIVRIPRHDGPYAAFVKALVERYGPNGSFWRTSAAARSGVATPITMWQIWNEPNIYPFWPLQPFAKRYVALLKAAHDAIKSADPKAKIVLAGMPNYSWLDLGHVYHVKGARKLFDIVAVHPYTKDPSGVITILGYVRRAMSRAGDSRKPLIADEISWPSSQGETNHDTGYDFATTQSGQAQNVKVMLPMLEHDRASLGLIGFYYYDWAGEDRPNKLAFDFAGLLHFQDGKFTPKPAFNAFRQAALGLEGCRAKGQFATDCVH